MLSLSPTVRVFLSRAPADLRKSFDGLSGLILSVLEGDPLSGHFFVFRNRRGDRLKLLCWDGDGFVIVYKRLEQGTFRFPPVPDGVASVEIRAVDLNMLLAGIDLATVKRHQRYRREPTGLAKVETKS